MVNPLAMAKKRARSFVPTFPDASAIFNGIDNDALAPGPCLLAHGSVVAFDGDIANSVHSN